MWYWFELTITDWLCWIKKNLEMCFFEEICMFYSNIVFFPVEVLLLFFFNKPLHCNCFMLCRFTDNICYRYPLVMFLLIWALELYFIYVYLAFCPLLSLSRHIFFRAPQGFLLVGVSDQYFCTYPMNRSFLVILKFAHRHASLTSWHSTFSLFIYTSDGVLFPRTYLGTLLIASWISNNFSAQLKPFCCLVLKLILFTLFCVIVHISLATGGGEDFLWSLFPCAVKAESVLLQTLSPDHTEQF